MCCHFVDAIQLRVPRLYPDLLRVLLSQHVCDREPVGLTHTPRLLPAPVRCGGVTAGEHTGALQFVAGETIEVSFPASMEVRHRDFAASRLFGERAAQHEGYRRERTGSTGRGTAVIHYM